MLSKWKQIKGSALIKSQVSWEQAELLLVSAALCCEITSWLCCAGTETPEEKIGLQKKKTAWLISTEWLKSALSCSNEVGMELVGSWLNCLVTR